MQIAAVTEDAGAVAIVIGIARSIHFCTAPKLVKITGPHISIGGGRQGDGSSGAD